MKTRDENVEAGSMTDKDSHGSVQASELGFRRFFPGTKFWAFTGIVLVLLALLSTVHDLFTRDDLHARIERPIIPDSPGVQFVGEVTKTRHYGLFHRGPADIYCGLTVLYEDHR